MVVLMATSWNVGVAQDTIVDLSTPRKAIHSHLKLLQLKNYFPEKAAKTIHVSDAKEAKELAIKLKRFLDAEYIFVDVDVAPNDPNYKDSITGLSRYGITDKYKKIYVEKVGAKWLYSDETAHAIPILYAEEFRFGSDKLQNLFPKFGQRNVLGLQIWQFVGIFLIILICIVLHKVLSLVLGKIIGVITNKYDLHAAHLIIITKVSRSLSMVFISLVLAGLAPAIMLPIEIGKFVAFIIHGLTPFFGMLFFYRMVDLFTIYFKKLAEKTESTLDDQLIPLIQKALKIFVIICGVIVILQRYDFNVTGLIAGISLGGLAFALAAQDTLKNLFGSLMIFIDRPFQVGDWINFDGTDGTVEEVGFRSTRVRTFANSLVSVPNGNIANTTINNMGKRVFRRFSTKIAVTYDTPPLLIEHFVQGLKAMVLAHPKTRKDYFEIHVNGMGDSSINILFYIFFIVPDWSQELKARQDMILGIMRLAENLGVNFAFPTQTLHMENFPGKTSLSPTYKTDADNMDGKTEQFLIDFKERNK